jgi:hypothetical protein
MAMSVVVNLLSGVHATIRLEEGSPLEELRRRARSELGVSIGKLVTSSGSVLPRAGNLAEAGVGDGDCLTAVIQEVVVAASHCAFASIREDGSVVAWGDAESGGDCSAVQHQLYNVHLIQASCAAFAALRTDGCVVTWGSDGCGGDSSGVQGQLRDVCEIQATAEAFAAIRADGSVVTWGDSGGDCSQVRDQLYNVGCIQANSFAFAALRGDGTVVTWGDALAGGDSTAVQSQLKDVLRIFNCGGAFAAIKPGGQVVCWGRRGYTDDGDASANGELAGLYKTGLRDVEQAQFSAQSAVVADGSGQFAVIGRTILDCRSCNLRPCSSGV